MIVKGELHIVTRLVLLQNPAKRLASRRIIRHTDAQLRPIGLCRTGQQAVVFADPLCVGDDPLPLLSKSQSVGTADKDPAIQLLFQRGKGVADRRLRNKQLLGSQL